MWNSKLSLKSFGKTVSKYPAVPSNKTNFKQKYVLKLTFMFALIAAPTSKHSEYGQPRIAISCAVYWRSRARRSLAIGAGPAVKTSCRTPLNFYWTTAAFISAFVICRNELYWLLLISRRKFRDFPGRQFLALILPLFHRLKEIFLRNTLGARYVIIKIVH